MALATEGQVTKGREIDPNTQAWWARQSEEARKVFTEKCVPVTVALPEFVKWIKAHGYTSPNILMVNFSMPAGQPVLR